MRHGYLENAKKLLGLANVLPTEDLIQNVWMQLSLARPKPEVVEEFRKQLTDLRFRAHIIRARNLLREARERPSVHVIRNIRHELEKAELPFESIDPAANPLELEQLEERAHILEVKQHFEQLRRIPTEGLVLFIREKIVADKVDLMDVEEHSGELDELEQMAIKLVAEKLAT